VKPDSTDIGGQHISGVSSATLKLNGKEYLSTQVVRNHPSLSAVEALRSETPNSVTGHHVFGITFFSFWTETGKGGIHE